MKKILTTITFFIFALAIAQEIKNDLPYISFRDLSDFSESSKEVSRTMIYRSEKLAKIFDLNNKFFYRWRRTGALWQCISFRMGGFKEFY